MFCLCLIISIIVSNNSGIYGLPESVFASTDKKQISSPTSGFDLTRVMNIRRLRSDMCSFDGVLIQVVCAGKMPTFPKVEAGKDYYFCTCGRSKNQPW